MIFASLKTAVLGSSTMQPSSQSPCSFDAFEKEGEGDCSRSKWISEAGQVARQRLGLLWGRRGGVLRCPHWAQRERKSYQCFLAGPSGFLPAGRARRDEREGAACLPRGVGSHFFCFSARKTHLDWTALQPYCHRCQRAAAKQWPDKHSLNWKRCSDMGAAGFPFGLPGLTMSGADSNTNKHTQSIACLGQKMNEWHPARPVSKSAWDWKHTWERVPPPTFSTTFPARFCSIPVRKTRCISIVLGVRGHFKCADTFPWVSAGQLPV